MCICFVFLNDDPSVFPYRLCLAANRDEYFARPAFRLQRWKDPDSEIIGGRDIQAGGTWLAVNSRTGKIGVLLNMRDRQASATVRDSKLSRGSLIPEYLYANLDAKSFAEALHSKSERYDPFTLLMLEPYGGKNGAFRAHYFNNVTKQHYHFSSAEKPESFGFGNSHPDQPFLKVKQGLRKFDDIIRGFVPEATAQHGMLADNEIKSAFFSLLSSTESHFPDEIMAQAFPLGFPEHHLTKLSSINVQAPEMAYGTRVQTLILVGFDGNAVIVEKNVVPASHRTSQVCDGDEVCEDLVTLKF